MNTQILDVTKIGEDLQITVLDPQRQVTAIPGVVFLSGIEMTGLVLRSNRAAIESALGTYLPIRSGSRYADLQRIRIRPNLSQANLQIFASQFESARLNRLTSDTQNHGNEENPDPNTGGGNPDPDYTSVMSGAGYEFKTWHLAAVAVAVFLVYRALR